MLAPAAKSCVLHMFHDIACCMHPCSLSRRPEAAVRAKHAEAEPGAAGEGWASSASASCASSSGGRCSVTSLPQVLTRSWRSVPLSFSTSCTTMSARKHFADVVAMPPTAKSSPATGLRHPPEPIPRSKHIILTPVSLASRMTNMREQGCRLHTCDLLIDTHLKHMQHACSAIWHSLPMTSAMSGLVSHGRVFCTVGSAVGSAAPVSPCPNLEDLLTHAYVAV